MKFDKIDLFDWLKTRPAGYRDLASSGVHGPDTMGELGISLNDLPISHVNQYGYLPLREYLAAKYGLSVDQVAITPGASMANYVLMTLMLQDNGVAVLEYPVYRPFTAVAEAITEHPPLFFERRREERYALNPKSLDNISVDPSLVIATNLHNPTGVFTPFESILKLADAVAARNGWLMVDEIFLPYIETMQWRTTAALHDRIIATGSLTKAWGLSGLRVGWVLGPKEIIYRVQRLIDYMHVVQATSAEVAAYRVLECGKGDELLRDARKCSQDNLPIVIDALKKLPDIEWIEPDGGVILLARRTSGLPTLPFCERLYVEENVLIQPGHYFEAPDAVRIGFAAKSELVRDHMERFSRVWNSMIK